mgnify:CR=1 FL=1
MTEYKIFIDTSPYIYYLERNPQYYVRTMKYFIDKYDKGNIFFTSAITIEEYSVIPYRENNTELLNDFKVLLIAMETEIVDITQSIADKAAQIRAQYNGFKPMDALQLAAAVESKCDLFLTNDKQLRQFTGIKVLTMEDI